jgi:signal transduction histidine kinase
LVIGTEKDEGDRLRLTVQDTGVGITPHDMERLFEAFYTTKSDGMGIGLSVSRSIIERHRGRLWATSKDGRGATFSFSIPQEPRGAARTGDFNIDPRNADWMASSVAHVCAGVAAMGVESR